MRVRRRARARHGTLQLTTSCLKLIITTLVSQLRPHVEIMAMDMDLPPSGSGASSSDQWRTGTLQLADSSSHSASGRGARALAAWPPSRRRLDLAALQLLIAAVIFLGSAEAVRAF